jgi:DeoR/GlpR family transcriptional regulator of sugar metabolism
MHNSKSFETSDAQSSSLMSIGGKGDAPTREEKREILPAWVQRCSEVAIDWKQAIASHAATHLLRYGIAIQIGSGTTFSRLMDEIVAMQKRKSEPLDLVILTTNLQVLEKGRDARHADPEIFNDMQIILTGGSLQLSLHSLAGEYAAEGVRTEIIFPRVVFFGAAGLTFDGGEVTITYQFQDELSTQVSYASRPTVQRVILCDHTKLGTRSAWKAEITAKTMLSGAEECIIISTFPDGDDPAEVNRIKQQTQQFDILLERLRKDTSLDGKDFSLRFVNRRGEVFKEFSLSAKRKELNDSRIAGQKRAS